MEKVTVFAILIILVTSFIGIYILGSGLTGMFIGFGQPTNAEWWNTSWHYRMRLEVNSTSYDRTDWPVERLINFTDLVPFGTFDENSTRIFEYDSGGSVLYEVPSQFDMEDDYDESSNAIGTVVFLMNGTTSANTQRVYYVYYDIVENGAKPKQDYSTSLSYAWDGEEFNVNNSLLRVWVDTLRGENTSGIARVFDVSYSTDVMIWPLAGSARTYEYMEYSNGTYNFSFDLANSATLKHNGSVRMVVEQEGPETLWDSETQTEGYVVKRYVFYENNRWFKVETNFTNTAGSDITRNSSFAGAVTFDASRAFGPTWQSGFGNVSSPGWWYASDYYNDFQCGITQVNQTGTSNFWIPNASGKSRMGAELNSTLVGPGSSITETVAFRFSYQEDYTKIRDLRDMLANPEYVNQSLPEQWYSIVVPSTNESIYNRNETMLITGDVSSGDPYNITKYLNATLDMGTPSTADDQTIILYDDGAHEDGAADDKVFSNIFEIENGAEVGNWSVNFTSYGNSSEFLNYTIHNFNVTDVLNLSVNISNKKPMIDSIVTAILNLRNYRMDTWIPGATINCTYNAVEVVNKTDYGNGTYSVNFTAPSQEGPYDLYCNATKNGNFGNNSDSFTAEPAKTNVSIYASPDNPSLSSISLYQNETFALEVNATNLGNGTAYSSNISLELLAGWDANLSLEQCGEIEKSQYCLKAFNITVPNGTVPGSYYINSTVSWINPDSTNQSNMTQINVTVESNPIIEVAEDYVASEAGDGTWNDLGNFTVNSIGNDDISNITFSCYSGTVCTEFGVEFLPVNISSMSPWSNQSVMVNVTIPLDYDDGTYNGTVNVSSENDGFEMFNISLTIPAQTNASLETIPEYTAYNITQDNSEWFEFLVNMTNIGNSSARYANMNLSIPSNWSINLTEESCGNLTRDQICSKAFNITVPNGTISGSYYVNITSNWTNNDDTVEYNQSSINVTVASNPKLNVTPGNISGNVPDGEMHQIENFTVLSVGNGHLQNISFDCYQGEVCQNFTVDFSPVNITTLLVNTNQTVSVNITVPLSYPTGNYSGLVNVSAENDNYNILNITVEVPSNRTWSMDPTLCQRSEYPDEGTACEITVSNLGNDLINFTVSPASGNYTQVNSTSFNINAGLNHTFNVTYNVSGTSQQVYYSLFLVDALQANSNPDSENLNITLLPYLPPLINLSISPSPAEQNDTVEFFVNITDRSYSGIVDANINITMPDGTSNLSNLTLLNTTGNLTQWYFSYPYSNTLQRGTYNYTISALDAIGNLGNQTSNFSVYTKLLITSTTLSSNYFQGDTGSIYYIIKNMTGSGINGTSVAFSIMNPTNDATHYTEQVTNSEGTIVPTPTFLIPSDALTGNYTLLSNTTYYDDVANITVFIDRNSTFEVESRTVTVTGLFADIETAVAWYPNNVMRFGILVYNGEGRPVDPDDINLTVYDPADNLYLNASLSAMTKEAVGYYTYSHAMGASSPVGMYLAVANITQDDFQTMKIKAFRVSQGGPYDVRLNLFENEVPQGDYLDFEIIIENKGEVTQDVFVEYNVTSQTGNYYSFSEAVLTPAFSNQSFTRTAYIYSDQPLGTYVLNAKVHYSTVQPEINANTTFTVVSAQTPKPPPAQSPPGERPTYYVVKPTQETEAGILITGYNSNISLARGITKIERVTVKNSGRVSLNNVSLFVLGIPTDWFNITPERYVSLVPDNSSVFLIEFNVPENTNVGSYRASLLAVSGVVSDQKSADVNIFGSLKELLEEEIRKLEEDLIDLKVEIRIAEMEGKDVSDVLTLVDTIESYIAEAKDYLRKNDIDLGMEKINSSLTLMKRARDLLDMLEVEEPETLSIFVIFILVIVIIVIVFPLVYFWRKKRLKEVTRPYTMRIRNLVERVKRKEVDIEKLQKEKEKSFRMLKVLDKEKSEGLITGDTYKKMKSGLEKKIAEIEKKMK